MVQLARRWSGIIMVLSVLVGSWLPTATVLAAGNSPAAASNDIGFSVAAHIPKNQINPKNSFFDLQMKPNQVETLSTTIYNTTNRDIQVQMAIHTAYTNANGSIEYVKPAQQYDPSLKYPLSHLTKIEGPSTVTVPGSASKVVSVRVSMPSTAINGVLLGGWYFKRVDQPVTGTVKGTTNVQNDYSYVIGLRYANGKMPAPTVQLTSVAAGLYDYHRGIMVNLRNPRAIMIPNVTMTTTITDANHVAVFNNVKQSGVQLAPNTRFEYPLLLGNTNLQAGRYHLHMVLQNKQHRWQFDRDFTITRAEARAYNRRAVDNKGLQAWWLLVMGALAMLVLVLILLGSYWLVKKRRQRTA